MNLNDDKAVRKTDKESTEAAEMLAPRENDKRLNDATPSEWDDASNLGRRKGDKMSIGNQTLANKQEDMFKDAPAKLNEVGNPIRKPSEEEQKVRDRETMIYVLGAVELKLSGFQLERFQSIIARKFSRQVNPYIKKENPHETT